MSQEPSPEYSGERAQKAGQFYAASLGNSAGVAWTAAILLESGNVSENVECQCSQRKRESMPSYREAITQNDGRQAGLTNESVGCKLLRKAGYKGRGGLGAREQGAIQPLQAWKQSGKEGIGAAPQTRGSGERQKDAGVDPARGPNNLGKDENQKNRGDSDAKKRELKRKWPSVKVEEDVDTKVKRWKQVMQAEANEAAGKELSRHIFCLFRDDQALDSNPLTRRNNLSSSNPLL